MTFASQTLPWLARWTGVSLVNGTAAAPLPSADRAAASRPAAYKAYVILDQSAKSDAFLQALKELTHPDLVAVNRLRRDHSGIKVSAGRHPLAYLLPASGVPELVIHPAQFVKRVNALAAREPGLDRAGSDNQ